jgi:DNA-binding PadR family transcriptional regulator
VLTTKPELEVLVERQVISAKGDTLRGRIARLIAGGLFDRGATAPATQKELARRGDDPGPGNVYKELDALAVMGFLTIEQGRDERSRPRKEYHAVKDMVVNIVER